MINTGKPCFPRIILMLLILNTTILMAGDEGKTSWPIFRGDSRLSGNTLNALHDD